MSKHTTPPWRWDGKTLEQDWGEGCNQRESDAAIEQAKAALAMAKES